MAIFVCFILFAYYFIFNFPRILVVDRSISINFFILKYNLFETDYVDECFFLLLHVSDCYNSQRPTSKVTVSNANVAHLIR